MSNLVAIDFNDTELHYLVLHAGQVQATGSVPRDESQDMTALGQRLAASLAPHVSGRSKAIVAVRRKLLEWQLLSLPPCPEQELPDLVRLQADRELSNGDEDVGFDYLSLTGDEHTSHQVLSVGISAQLLNQIRQLCEAAHLSLEHLIPSLIGWPALVEGISATPQGGTHLFVAPQGNSAALWATKDGKVTMLRQCPLPSTEDSSAVTSALANELRRSLLAMSQNSDEAIAGVTIVDASAERLAELSQQLKSKLDVTVSTLSVGRLLGDKAQSFATESLPLVGLALSAEREQAPLVDLVHPHQKVREQVNVRTYALAGVAAALLIVLLGWTGYARLSAPLQQAERDQAELTLIEESLDNLKVAEQKAAAVREWEQAAPNLLAHLKQLSEKIRPQGFRDEAFPVDRDVVLQRVVLNKRELQLDAFARNSRAVQPLENRLREANYHPERTTSEPSDTLSEYPWHFKAIVDIPPDSDPDVESPTERQTAEPDDKSDGNAEEDVRA